MQSWASLESKHCSSAAGLIKGDLAQELLNFHFPAPGGGGGGMEYADAIFRPVIYILWLMEYPEGGERIEGRTALFFR